MLVLKNGFGTIRRFLSAHNSELIRGFDFTVNKSKSTPVTGFFDNPRLNEPDGLTKMAENVETRANDLISRIYTCEGNPLPLFDELSDSICQVADLAEFLRHCGPLLSCAQACFIKLSALVERLNTDIKLFDKISNYKFESGLDNYVSKLYAIDFEQCGIHLATECRKRFCDIQNELVTICSQFQEGCYKPAVLKCTRGLKSASSKTVTWNSYHNLNDENERESHYRAFFGPNQTQEELFTQMISKRHELANVCGFPGYSDRILRTSMLSSPSLVMKLLDDLSVQLKPHLLSEYKILEAFKRSAVRPWDFPYLTMSYIRNMSNFDYSQCAAYFSLGTCVEGINMIVRRLFNVHMRLLEPKPGELWDDEVKKLGVYDVSSEELLGFIYCDFIERKNKAHIECHFTIRCTRTLQNGGRQTPIIVLHLNFPAGNRNEPVLLSPGMMENLFHEFGHAFHSMLSMTSYQHVAGTRCAIDFAETPSQLFEYYGKDFRVLSMFARHWKTGEPIPRALLSSLCNTRKHFIACDLQNQVFYSLLDQRLHSADPFLSIKQISDLYSSRMLMAYVNDTYPYLRFAHFVEYGSKYYSYIVSKAIASIFWHSQLKADPLSSSVGEKLKREVLSRGGECPPNDLAKAFIGKELNVSDIIDGILSEVSDFSLQNAK